MKNNGNPLISIVTVCFNSVETISDTLNSVLNQSYSYFEYIIIDGKSTDNTLEVIKKYEKKFLSRKITYKWISEKDNGIYDAYNKGIIMSKGKYIGILNSDDWYEPDTLSIIANELEDNTIITGELALYTYDKRYLSTTKCNKNIKKKIKKKMPVSHPSTFVPKNVYNSIGLYNVKYALSADYDFIFRCVLSNKRFKCIPKVLTNMRNSGATSKNINLFITAKENFQIRKGYKIQNALIYFIRDCIIGVRIIIVRSLKSLLLKNHLKK